jgi:hypothetical protein
LPAIDFSSDGPYRKPSSMRGNVFRPSGGGQLAVLAGEGQRHEVSCFADEVVIDFPSVAPAVDRMRRAFVAEEAPSACAATISLTPHEARSGATIPLDVPVACMCRRCGGRGESWTESCPWCIGTGTEFLRHQVQVTVPAGVADGARFCFTVTPRHHPPTRVELHVFVGA